MSAIQFRTARPGDIAAMLALFDGGAVTPGANPPSDPADPVYLEAFNIIAADPNHTLVVAELEGEIVGTLQISFIPGLSQKGAWRGLLENVHVRADQRGKGTGAALMNHAIEICRAHGCFLVQLTSNKQRVDAHRFYERLGFEASHEGFKLFL